MKVTGPENLVRVEFYIDELLIGEATSAPYRIQFTTDDYTGGIHTMYAVGFTNDGNKLNSREFTANFVSADQGWKTTQRMIIPVVGILVVAILLAVVIPAVVTRGKITRLRWEANGIMVFTVERSAPSADAHLDCISGV